MVCSLGDVNILHMATHFDIEYNGPAENKESVLTGEVRIRVQMGHFIFKTGLQPLPHLGYSRFSLTLFMVRHESAIVLTTESVVEKVLTQHISYSALGLFQ